MSQEMYKFAGQIIDQYDDPLFVGSFEAQTLFGEEIPEPTELSKLADADFAVKIAGRAGDQRRFPVSTPMATAISCQYFARVEDALPQEICKAAGYFLGQACERFDLPKNTAVAKYAEEVPKHVKTVTKTASVRVPLDRATEIAQQKIANQLGYMTPERRVEAAIEFTKIADTVTNQQVWDYVPKATPGPLFHQAIEDRKVFIRNSPAYKQIMMDELEENWISKTAEEIATTLIEFDRFNGLHTRYKDGLIDPYKAVYGGHALPQVLEKVAAEMTGPAILDVHGESLTKEAAAEMSIEDHVHALMTNYPKGSTAYQVESNEDRGDWGTNYAIARNYYFSG